MNPMMIAHGMLRIVDANITLKTMTNTSPIGTRNLLISAGWLGCANAIIPFHLRGAERQTPRLYEVINGAAHHYRH
jgi:hypothetical protein